jgi:K+-sensing histidine kinase KdpD
MSLSSVPPSTGGPALPNRDRPPPRFRRFWERRWGNLRHWIHTNTFAPAWLPRQMQHPLVGYLVALLLQLVATGLDLLLVQVFGEFALPGVPIVLVIVFVGLFWGVGPSLVALIVGVTLLDYAVMPPHFAFDIPDVPDALEVGLLMLLGFLVAITASQRERARRRAEELATLLRQAHAQAERESLRLQQVLEVLPAGIHISNLEGQLLEMNATMRALWELEETPVGQRVRTLAKG